MKTPMTVFNTAMQKKKKNRKGFSLVELIVVLVIMAILSAALIPSLIGYISKTKEQNVQSECQSAVTAAQTIASGIYASAANPASYTFKDANGTSHTVAAVGSATGSNAGATEVAALAEVSGTIISIKVSSEGLIQELVYAEGNGSDGKKACKYERTSATSAGTYNNGKMASGAFSAT